MSEMARGALDRAIDEMDEMRGTAFQTDGHPDSERLAFLERHPFDRFWDDLERRVVREDARTAVVAAESRPSLLARLVGIFQDWQLAGALSAAALMLVLGTVWVMQQTAAPEAGLETAPTVRFKGGHRAPAAASAVDSVRLDYFVLRGVGGVRGTSGEALGDGDRIRFAYTSGANEWLMLLSLEESGKVSVFYPDLERGEALQSVKIPRGRNVPLEGSVILNDYIGSERFFALFSDAPLAVEDARAAATAAWRKVKDNGGSVRDIERLALDAEQSSFWIEKR